MGIFDSSRAAAIIPADVLSRPFLQIDIGCQICIEMNRDSKSESVNRWLEGVRGAHANGKRGVLSYPSWEPPNGAKQERTADELADFSPRTFHRQHKHVQQPRSCSRRHSSASMEQSSTRQLRKRTPKQQVAQAGPQIAKKPTGKSKAKAQTPAKRRIQFEASSGRKTAKSKRKGEAEAEDERSDLVDSGSR